MRQNETKHTEKNQDKENHIHNLKFDQKRLSDVLNQLNIARKNFLIYPPGHVQTNQSLKKCHALLLDLLELDPEITIGVAKDKIFVGNTLIEDKNPNIKDFALSAKNHELAGITLFREISADDLSCFFQLMAKDSEEIENLGGFDKALADNKVKTIKLQFIDYRAFHHREEIEIDRTKNRKSKTEGSAIWSEFISGLLSGSLTTSSQGVPLEQAKGINPSQLALFLNENKIDTKVALDTYRSAISRRIQDVGESTASPSTYTNHSWELELLLQNLNPKLKKQFLSATYSQLSSVGDNAAKNNFLMDLSEKVVLDMLKQANEDGEEISPSLMNFVYKMASAEAEMSHPEGEMNFDESTNPIDLISDTKPLQDILIREKFEEYVTTDYENTLNNLSGDIDNAIIETNKVLPIEDFHKELAPSHVNSQVANIILAFMNNDIKLEVYENYATKLVDIAYDLLRTGVFPTLLKIFKVLFKHYKDKADPKIQSLAKDTLKKFREDRFISMAVVSFEKWAQPDDTAAYECLLSLGSKIVLEMVALYGKGERSEIQSLIFKLLNNFPKETCFEAKRRLHDPQPSFVTNMLTLVREIGVKKDALVVRKLLEHRDTDVRITAMEALVKLGDPDSPGVIRNFLKSTDSKRKLKIIELIGNYKVADLVPDLISDIPRWTLFKSQFERNEAIISALGEIGDPSAIPVLKKLANCRWSLWSKSLNRMKLTLYRSLHSYELSQITSLLNIGRGSKDIRIRQICQKIGSKN